MPQMQQVLLSLGDWETCGEPPCEEYTFIGHSPMNKPLSLHETREAYLSFYEKNGHGRVKRYPSWPAGGTMCSHPGLDL